MARVKSHFECQECGAISPGYLGRCPSCESWGSMVETVDTVASKNLRVRPSTSPTPVRLSDVDILSSERMASRIGEFDRVLGGGLVSGSLVLIGGDPGIGKSTIALQVAASVGSGNRPVLYASGEESETQIRLRADRLGIADANILVQSESDLGAILAAAEKLEPAAVVVDSIQTARSSSIESSAGTVSQVRESTAEILRWAKPRRVPVLLVGHVTKEGNLAGPRVLEHMVDVVLYLEGDRYQQFRILRSVKNRFGSTDEVGVFEMAEDGLRGVANASEAFLQERAHSSAGSIVAVTMEGTRPILVEVQALTSSTVFGNPRRSASGLDIGRLQLLAAVLQRRVHVQTANQDIFANVVGGLRIAEPGVDLPLALAIISSVRDEAIDTQTVAMGEVGLSGEVRSIGQLNRRLNEASRLGFKRAIVPAQKSTRERWTVDQLEVVPVRTLAEASGAIFN